MSGCANTSQSIYNELTKDVEKINRSNQEVEWKQIKEILSGIASSLELISNTLPTGAIKNIISGLVGMIQLVCNQLPDINLK